MTRRKFLVELRKVFHQSQEAVIHYLTREIKFLLAHLSRRPKPTESEKAALARAAKALDPAYLERTFNPFTPATLMRWYRKLVAKKWDYSRLRKYPGRPKISRELEELIVKLALENPHDGYLSIVGRLKLLGFEANPETVQNVLERNGIPPSPERIGRLTWKEFVDIHWENLAATDFLTWEVLTPFGLVTYYILFFLRHLDRKVYIAGLTTHPNED
jgi:putative transposase